MSAPISCQRFHLKSNKESRYVNEIIEEKNLIHVSIYTHKIYKMISTFIC